MTVEHTDANIQRLVETELATVKPERILEDWKMRRLNELRSDAAPLHGIVRRPPAICCPGCGQIVELVEKACNYPCERCGVLWRWYYRPGMQENIEVVKG